MHDLIVNSRFLSQNITGVQRFAIEVSRQLKKLASNRIFFVVPGIIMHTDIAEELDAKIVGINCLLHNINTDQIRIIVDTELRW